MKPDNLPSLPMLSLGVLLTAGLLISGCTRGGGVATDLSSNPPAHPSLNEPAPADAAQTFDPADRSQYRYLYAVYCNGTVDRLDLVRREKAGSFQLAERSGNPPAVAALRIPTMRPDICLARPVVTNDMRDQADGVVHIVASDTLDRYDDGQRADFRLLTFTLPDWTLRHVQYLGDFEVLNNPDPRMVRVTDGYLIVQPRVEKYPDKGYSISPPGSEPWWDMAELVQNYAGGKGLEWLHAIQWSAGNVLLRYALPNRDGSGFALANQSRRRIVHLPKSSGEEIPPEMLLAPGGNFVLLIMYRDVPLGGDQSKYEFTGELHLYDAEGLRVATLMAPSIEGRVQALAQAGRVDEVLPHSHYDWFPIALTPQGLAVFTDLIGNYRFVDLGRTFGVEPVINPRASGDVQEIPEVVYARE